MKHIKEEFKLLLFKDLYARLPYGTIIQVKEWAIVDTELKFGHIERLQYDEIELKPYLRPMSSMTEEEEKEYDATFATIKLADGHYDSTMTYKSFDFLNAHHFDYRGLIEKDLALVAKEDMYKTKTEIIEEIKTWWKSYKEILKPDELICIEDPCEMILKWADYNERDLGLYDLETLEEIAKELNIFKI